MGTHADEVRRRSQNSETALKRRVLCLHSPCKIHTYAVAVDNLQLMSSSWSSPGPIDF